MKHHTFEMLRVFAKVWYTAMINGNCGNRTVIEHGMMSCCILCSYAGFSACHDFSVFFVCHSLSQSWTSSIGLVSLESRSWSWTSKSWSWSWSWNCWVLVLVLEPQSLGLGEASLGLGLGLGEASLESKSVYFCLLYFVRPFMHYQMYSQKYLQLLLWKSANGSTG